MEVHRKAQLQLHVSVFLFGFTAILGALISLSSVPLVWWRILLTVGVYLVYLRLRGPIPRLPWADLRMLALVGLTLGLHWVTFYASIKLIGASVTLICLSSATFFTALIGPLMAKRPHSLREILLGVVVLLGIGLIFTFQNSGWGMLVGIFSALLSALVGILNKRVVGKYQGTVINFYELACCLAVFTVLAPAYHWLYPAEALVPASTDWLWMLLLAFVCTNFAYDLSMRALRHLSAFDFILAINLEPIYGIVLAFLFLGEAREVNWAFFVGAALVFGAVFYDVFLAFARRMVERPQA